MKTITFSPAAEIDLDGIWKFTAKKRGIERANAYIDEIRDACHGLATGGAMADAGSPNVLGFMRCLCGHHAIYFLDYEKYIEVIRILHQRQNSENHS